MRYIDADALYEKLYPLDLVDKRLYTINAKAVADAIANTPTADVVPRSEVEELKNIYKKYNKAIRHERVEVAREIFEEIEKLTICRMIPDVALIDDRLITDIAELKRKYTEGGAE